MFVPQWEKTSPASRDVLCTEGQMHTLAAAASKSTLIEFGLHRSCWGKRREFLWWLRVGRWISRDEWAGSRRQVQDPAVLPDPSLSQHRPVLRSALSASTYQVMQIQVDLLRLLWFSLGWEWRNYGHHPELLGRKVILKCEKVVPTE